MGPSEGRRADSVIDIETAPSWVQALPTTRLADTKSYDA